MPMRIATSTFLGIGAALAVAVPAHGAATSTGTLELTESGAVVTYAWQGAPLLGGPDAALTAGLPATAIRASDSRYLPVGLRSLSWPGPYGAGGCTVALVAPGRDERGDRRPAGDPERRQRDARRPARARRRLRPARLGRRRRLRVRRVRGHRRAAGDRRRMHGRQHGRARGRRGRGPLPRRRGPRHVPGLRQRARRRPLRSRHARPRPRAAAVQRRRLARRGGPRGRRLRAVSGDAGAPRRSCWRAARSSCTPAAPSRGRCAARAARSGPPARRGGCCGGRASPGPVRKGRGGGGRGRFWLPGVSSATLPCDFPVRYRFAPR